MKRWHFWDQTSGAISSHYFCAPNDRALRDNTPAGLIPIEGTYDHLSQRVDLATGKVIDYRPDQPDDDHEWNERLRRWTKRPEAMAKQIQATRAQRQIERLEKQQARPMRELARNPGDAAARRRIDEIDAEIEALRAQL
jgi:hypothetical protein